MLSTLYICCSAGDTVKRPLEAQGDRSHRPDELESNLLFALGVSALAVSFWCTKSSSCPQRWKSGPGRVASRSPSHFRAGVVLQTLSLHIQVSQWVEGTAAPPALPTTPYLCPQRLALPGRCHSRTQIAVTCAVRGNLFQHIFGSTCLQMPRVFCVPQLLNRIKCCCSTMLEGKGHVSRKKLVGESWCSLWQPPRARGRNVLIREAHFFWMCAGALEK